MERAMTGLAYIAVLLPCGSRGLATVSAVTAAEAPESPDPLEALGIGQEDVVRVVGESAR